MGLCDYMVWSAAQALVKDEATNTHRVGGLVIYTTRIWHMAQKVDVMPATIQARCSFQWVLMNGKSM